MHTESFEKHADRNDDVGALSGDASREASDPIWGEPFDELIYRPLEESWKNILNLTRPNLEDPGSLVAGERNPRGKADYQCRHHDGISGRCWKNVCYRAHDYMTGEQISSRKMSCIIY